MDSPITTYKYECIRATAKEHFEKGDYGQALHCYTACLKECSDATLYANRALCHLRLHMPRDAMDDCNKALELEPTNIKAMYRKALANKLLTKYSDALWCLKPILHIDPSNHVVNKEYSTILNLWKQQLAADSSYSTESSLSSDEMSLDVILTCTSQSTTCRKTVRCRRDIKTILDLKLLVEEQLNIPATLQTITYESQLYDDSTSLKSLSVQTGDSFFLMYPSDADCKPVEKIVAWLFEVLYYLVRSNPSVDMEENAELGILMARGFATDLIYSKYFEDILDLRCSANMQHFVNKWGLNLLMEILELTQRVPWKKRVVKMKMVELMCLYAVEKFALRYSPLILSLKGLTLCRASLCHANVEKHCYVEDIDSLPLHRSSELLVSVMVTSVMILCRLCEHSNGNVEIAADSTMLKQSLNLSMAIPKETQLNDLGILAPQMVTNLFLGVSYSIATHDTLVDSDVLDNIMDSARMERPWLTGNPSACCVLLTRYLSSAFLAQLAIMSADKIPSAKQPHILTFLEEFLAVSMFKDVLVGGMKNTYVWTTFLPYVRLLYTPFDAHHHQDRILLDLWLCSTEVVILGLHSMLVRCNHRKVLLEEGLFDFILCLPTHTPRMLKEKAWELVHTLVSYGDLPVRPPSLTNLCKALLARTCLGLEFVLYASIAEIVNKVL